MCYSNQCFCKNEAFSRKIFLHKSSMLADKKNLNNFLTNLTSAFLSKC